MRWQLSLISGVFWLLGPLLTTVRADVQTGHYQLVVETAGRGSGTPAAPGPLNGVLPQLNAAQQWWLLLLGLVGFTLLIFLTIICWRHRQTIKEQPK
ncbi:cell surface protein [Lactiplantibacillus plajomi]|uniref:Cell surface protein n=1 Tax=Lactiplantibacillus plajomi TaxID=1457217 RepID=A0ABV6K6Q0_9LACO|nr:cell surface protein [Lactiplantibacillus plajomi]